MPPSGRIQLPQYRPDRLPEVIAEGAQRTLVEELTAEEPALLVEVQDDVVDAGDRVLDDALTHGRSGGDYLKGQIPDAGLRVPLHDKAVAVYAPVLSRA